MRIVLCDDDPVLLSVLRTSILYDHEVVAESDRAYEAAELAERLSADLLILDLSLGAGVGKDALDQLRKRNVPCEVIVFTSFTLDREVLRAAGAADVIEKPNFPLLQEAVADVAARVAARPPRERRATEPGDDRREAGALRPPMPPVLAKSPSGIEPHALFNSALAASLPGDAVLVVALDELDQLTRSWGDLVATDHRLAVARALRQALRDNDRMTVNDFAQLVVLLVGGRPEAAARVFRRVEEAWRYADGAGTIRGGFAVRAEGELPMVTLARAEGALQASCTLRVETLVAG